MKSVSGAFGRPVGRPRSKPFFLKGGGGGNLICLEGVRARGAGQGGGGVQYYYLLLCCKAGGGGNIIVWVRGGLTGRGEGKEDYHE